MNSSLNKKNIRKAYTKWLKDYPWQWFATLTFRTPPHPEQAIKKFSQWIHYLNRSLYGRRYYKKTKEIAWVLALEHHKSGVIHFHALLMDKSDLNESLSRQDANDKWVELAGWARIVKIDDKVETVTNYITKYVMKNGEIYVGPALEGFEQSGGEPESL